MERASSTGPLDPPPASRLNAAALGDSDRREPPLPVDDTAAVGVAKAAARPQPKTASNMNGPLYMQTSGSNVVLVRRLKRKEDGTWKHLARWFVENQIGALPVPRLHLRPAGSETLETRHSPFHGVDETFNMLRPQDTTPPIFRVQ